MLFNMSGINFALLSIQIIRTKTNECGTNMRCKDEMLSNITGRSVEMLEAENKL